MGYVEFHPRHVDALTQYIAQVDSDHAYIHKGWAFTYQKVLTLAGSATQSYILHTPADMKEIHFRPIRIGSSASPVVISIGEGPTFTGGTAATTDVWNRNRQLASTLPTVSTLTAGTITISDAGEILTIDHIGSGTNPGSASGGSIGAVEEIVFNKDTDYMIRVVNQTSTATQLTIAIFWYEEDEYHG